MAQPAELSVELYNTSTTLIWDLGGMYVGDGVTRQRIPDGTRIPPRGVWRGDLLFAPTGSTLTLYDRDCFANAVIATVTYPALTPGTSYARWPDGTGGWQILSTPTPGWLNVGRPPAITGVTHTVPLANMPVTVTATISDVGNITATLWYRMHQPLEAAPATYNAVPLVARRDHYAVRRHSACFSGGDLGRVLSRSERLRRADHHSIGPAGARQAWAATIAMSSAGSGPRCSSTN